MQVLLRNPHDDAVQPIVQTLVRRLPREHYLRNSENLGGEADDVNSSGDGKKFLTASSSSKLGLVAHVDVPFGALEETHSRM